MTKKLSCCAIRIAPLALCVAFVSSPALADIQSGQYTYADLDGTAYFDTGYKVKANSVFRFKMAALSSTANYQNLFADYVDESTQVTRVIVNGTSATDFIVNFFCKSSGNKNANGVVSARGDPVEGVLAYDYAILNSARYELTKKEGTASTATMKIGGRGQSDQGRSRFWYFTIEEGGVVVHDYVPYRENGKSGIKDLVTGDFLENASSGGTVTLEGWTSSLKVTASLNGIGSPSPAYGMTNGLAAGESFTVSCGTTPLASADGTIQYSCTGWKLYNESGVVVSTGNGTSFTYVHPNPAAYRRLEWQWTKSNIKPGRIACYFSGGTREGDTYTIGPRIDIWKSYPLTGSLSMSAWVCVSTNITAVKPSGGGYNGAPIAGQGFYGYEKGFGLLASGYTDNVTSNDSVALQIHHNDTVFSYGYKTNTLFSADEWHHYLLVRDKTAEKVRFYVDGELLSENDCPSSWIITPSRYFSIAYSRSGLGGSFCGYIADIALWNVALPVADARRLHRSGLKNVSTAPIAYFPLNEGWGGSVREISGSTTNYYNATGTLEWKVVPEFMHEPGMLIFVE